MKKHIEGIAKLQKINELKKFHATRQEKLAPSICVLWKENLLPAPSPVSLCFCTVLGRERGRILQLSISHPLTNSW